MLIRVNAGWGCRRRDEERVNEDQQTRDRGAQRARGRGDDDGRLRHAAAQAVGPDRLPLTITNSSGRGEAVYVYVLGTNLSTGRLGYVNAGGTFTAWPAGSNPPSAAPDVAIAGPGNGGSTTIQVPRGISGSRVLLARRRS